MELVEIDVRDIRSVKQLLALLVEKLHLKPGAEDSWKSLLNGLRHSAGADRTVRLISLHELEKVLPSAAALMLQTFGDHNNNPDASRYNLLAGGDYTATVVFLQFAVRRLIDDQSRLESALVNCWVKADEPDAAERTARASIESAGWTILSLDEAPTPIHDVYPPDDPRADHFAQALTDGGAYIFHIWT